MLMPRDTHHQNKGIPHGKNAIRIQNVEYVLQSQKVKRNTYHFDLAWVTF
jgi:hypothetical protein